jgi:GntR family transcriptional regulator, rspAB operon transcriptional repressor
VLDGLLPLSEKPQSLSEMVYDSIRSSIVSKRLRPGTVVAEASLAARLNVSKTPVREALLRLQSIGLVEPDRRGLRVVSPSEDSIREAYEVRLILEQGLARRAAEQGSPVERQEILNAAERSLQCAEAGDIAEGFRNWDRAFHRAISAAAHNVRLARLAEDAAVLASVLRERDVPGVQDAIQCGHQHLDMARAVCSDDADGAAGASDAHVNAVRDMVLAAFRERYESRRVVGK